MFSQTVEYALRAMAHLAALPPDRTVSSEAIAAQTKVPPGYLSKILRDLVVAGLVTSQRGPRGGFALASSSSDITMLDVIDAVDPIKRIKECPLGNPDHACLCPLHLRLDRAMDDVEAEFRRTTLAEIIDSGSVPPAEDQANAAPKPGRNGGRRDPGHD